VFFCASCKRNVSGETDLSTLIAHMQPELDDQRFGLAVGKDFRIVTSAVPIFALIQEGEGVSFVGLLAALRGYSFKGLGP
jgi:hypothetical protein